MNLGYAKLMEVVPPAKIEEYVDERSKYPKGLEEDTEEIESIAISAVWYAGYLDARRGGHDHAEAVDKANRCRAAFRRAMGYTYPHKGAIHV